MNFSRIIAHKNTRFFSHDKVENKLFKASVTGTCRSLGMTALQNSAAVTDVTFHSTHRKGYQSKLLFFHSKGGRCSFWGLLYCDDRRSTWWASRDGLKHDYIRSGTVMISMNFNSYASCLYATKTKNAIRSKNAWYMKHYRFKEYHKNKLNRVKTAWLTYYLTALSRVQITCNRVQISLDICSVAYFVL